MVGSTPLILCVCVCLGLTDQPDDVEGGVGEDGRVDFVEIVVRLFLASYGLPGHTADEERRNTHENKKTQRWVLTPLILRNDQRGSKPQHRSKAGN